MVSILSNPLLRPAKSLQAAPMQNRVLPFSFALRAASRTGSMSTSLEAFVGVEYRDDCEQYEPGNSVRYCALPKASVDYTVFGTSTS